MPFAHNDQISEDPIDGGIEISVEQYLEALSGMTQGKVVRIDSGFSVQPPPIIEIEEPPEPEFPVVPQVASRFQARAALMLTPSANAFDNMLAEVDAVMTHQDTDPMARLAWTEAQEFYRQSPTVLAMSAVLNLSDAQLDQLFTLAATLHA